MEWQPATRAWSAVPHDGSMILEVTLSGLQRTAICCNGPELTPCCLTCTDLGVKSGVEAKSGLGPAEEEEFQNLP